MSSKAAVIEVRSGAPQSPSKVEELWKANNNNREFSWPDQKNKSSYIKPIVKGDKARGIPVSFEGVEGNRAGFPGHAADIIDRAVMVQNDLSYEHLKIKFPESASTLVRGGFGENFVVNHPSLLPSEVCIGDVYNIGSAVFFVTGPRFPCPKVDAYHCTKGMTQYTKENGYGGFFLRVKQEGRVHPGDEIKLVHRPHPGFTIERVSRGLWGPADVQDNSASFLTALAEMPELIEQKFKDTAKQRLERYKTNVPMDKQELHKLKVYSTVAGAIVGSILLTVMFFIFAPYVMNHLPNAGNVRGA